MEIKYNIEIYQSLNRYKLTFTHFLSNKFGKAELSFNFVFGYPIDLRCIAEVFTYC